MSLNTDPYGINYTSVTAPEVKRVNVTVDGEDLGTAAEVVINSQAFADGGDQCVDLKDLTGIADVSFYGHVYRDLRKTNKELERKVSLADQIADGHGEDTAYWHKNYRAASELYAEYFEKTRKLTAEVERLKQSRKEQAEKHKQKQANLQANFEQRNVGRVRNTKLQRELDQAKNYARSLERENEELRSEQHSGLRGELNTAVENAKYLAERSDNLEARLKHEKASSTIWYEKYLAAEAQLGTVVSKHDYLVNSVNGISDIVNDAANRQGFDLG